MKQGKRIMSLFAFSIYRPCWKIRLVTEPKMPLADHVSVVTEPLEILWHQGEVSKQTPWLLRPEHPVLAAGVYRVSAGHQG